MMINKNRGLNLLDHFLLFLLIGQSSIPFFFGDEYLVLGAVLAAFRYFTSGAKFDKFIVIYLFIFSGLFFIHFINAGEFLINLIGAFVLRILFAYFVVASLKGKFIEKTTQQIYVLTIISLIFYFSIAVFPILYDYVRTVYTMFFQPLEFYTDNYRANIIIYTPEYWLQLFPPKNAGPFWEPGGFATFLTIALVFHSFTNNIQIDKVTVVLIIGLLTTFSTAGYITLGVFILFYLFYYRSIKNLLFSIPVFALILYFAFTELPFLEDKLTDQFQNAQLSMNEYSARSRFVSTQYDIENFLANPIFGKGRVEREAYERDVNGFTSFFKQFGIVGGLFFFGAILYSLWRIRTRFAIRKEWALYMFLLVIVSGLSQSIFTKPFFLALPLISISMRKENS